MDPLTNYVLPIGGLEIGIHRFQFKVDNYFLQHCEGSPYNQADVDAELIVDRRSNIIVLDVLLSGKVRCNCDRCTAEIDLPIQSEYQAILKVKDETELKTEDDIIYLQPGQTQFSISKLLYDVFLIAIPLKKTYDCESEEPLPCNADILNRLDSDTGMKTESDSSIWDELKQKLDFNK